MSSAVKTSIVVVILVLIGVIAFFLSADSSETTETNNQTATNQNSNESSNSSPLQETQLSSYTLQDVAARNNDKECWTIIDGSVYDITSYIPRHPGGSNILSACGVDSTVFFNGQEAGRNGGINNHGGSAEAQLVKLKIGTLLR